MSVKQMAKVWEHDWEQGEQLVMLSLADHAHHDGTEIRPAHELTAWKTGYHKRSVQRIVKNLRDRGILVVTRKSTRRWPTCYRIDWSKAKEKAPYGEEEDGDTAVAVAEPEIEEDDWDDRIAPQDDTTSGENSGTTPEPPQDEPSRARYAPARGVLRTPEPSGVLPVAPKPSGKKECSNEHSKKVGLSLPEPDKERERSTGRLTGERRVSDSEMRREWERIKAEDEHGDRLREIAQGMAAENKTGEVTIGRIYNQIIVRYRHLREKHPQVSEAAWTYGLETAIAAQAPNLNYAAKAAISYDPHAERRKPSAKKDSRDFRPRNPTNRVPHNRREE